MKYPTLKTWGGEIVNNSKMKLFKKDRNIPNRMFSESEIFDFISIISFLSDLNNLEKNKHHLTAFYIRLILTLVPRTLVNHLLSALTGSIPSGPSIVWIVSFFLLLLYLPSKIPICHKKISIKKSQCKYSVIMLHLT